MTIQRREGDQPVAGVLQPRQQRATEIDEVPAVVCRQDDHRTAIRIPTGCTLRCCWPEISTDVIRTSTVLALTASRAA